MNGFSGRPLVAGSILGLRAFDVDGDSLHGVTYPAEFKPGVNEAACSIGGMHDSLDRMALNIAKRRGTVPQRAPRKHAVAGQRCTCGFYAFFDGSNDYARRNRVVAVIRGTGVCTVGSRGFRASKAELVALVDPNPRAANGHDRWDRWSDWQYEHGGASSAMASLLPITSAWTGIGGGVAAILGGLWPLAIVAGLWVLLGIATGILSARGWTHGLCRNFPTIHPELTCSDQGLGGHRVSRDQFAQVVAKYGVPAYPTVDAMLADFPVVVPEFASETEAAS